MEYLCPACGGKSEHRIRTRIGQTDQVIYTYYHPDGRMGFQQCKATLTEPMAPEEAEKYKPKGTDNGKVY